MDGLKEDDGKWLWNPSGQNNPGTTAQEHLEDWKATNVWRQGKSPTTGPMFTVPAKQNPPLVIVDTPSTQADSPIPAVPKSVSPAPRYFAPTPALSPAPAQVSFSVPAVPRPTAPSMHRQENRTLSYATPKSGIPFVFEALQQREQHIGTLEKQLNFLKRRLEYDEIYGAGEPMEGIEETAGTGFWRTSLSHLTVAPEPLSEAPTRLHKLETTPVKSRRKPSHIMDTS